MGQVLHGSACATHTVRRSIQRSQATVAALADRHGINPKTVAKWRKRQSVEDAPMGPKAPRSAVLSLEEETTTVALRRHTLLPLDDCPYALQPTIPHLARSSLHRCLKRHRINRLPDLKGEAAPRKRFKRYSIVYVHVDTPRCGPRKARGGCPPHPCEDLLDGVGAYVSPSDLSEGVADAGGVLAPGPRPERLPHHPILRTRPSSARGRFGG